MPSFSKQSSDKLATCDPRLQKVFNHVIQFIDFRITEGHRNKEDQDKAFANGNSKLKWPKGPHNSLPSKAVDALILPVDFDTSKPRNLARYYYFAGFVMATAASMNIQLTFGGNWDNDADFSDERFLDLVHFQIRE